MRQIIQDLKKGDTILEDVPAPVVRKGYVLIKTHRSLVSLGTEKMLVEFGQSNLISKARQQPEKVKQVFDKIKTEGLLPTLEAVFNKLDEPLPLGYCNAGEVIAVGEGVIEFRVGDRVASNGHHAEIVCIAKNLVAKIPENVSYEEASFTVIGSIGLQGIRLVNPTIGETVVVMDVKKKLLGGYELYTHNGKKSSGKNPVEFAKMVEQMGAGEIVVNSIDQDGIMKGYDMNITDKIRQAISLPLTVLGGAGNIQDIGKLISSYGIIGAAAGSLFVFKGVYKAVLINYPNWEEKDKLINEFLK
jgi:hypothetical protein